MKRNVIKRGKSFGVTEAHIFVANIACDARRSLLVDPTRLDRFIENLKHTLTGGASSLHELIELMQSACRIVQECRQHEERNQIANLHRTRQHGATPEREDNDGAKCFEHRH